MGERNWVIMFYTVLTLSWFGKYSLVRFWDFTLYICEHLVNGFNNNAQNISGYIKELVHSKMNIRSSFTLVCFQTCMTCFFRYSEILKYRYIPLKVSGVQFCFGPYWLSLNKNGWKFFKISYFVFHRRKKAIQVWNDMVSKWWQNFHFWVNYIFKSSETCSKK